MPSIRYTTSPTRIAYRCYGRKSKLPLVLLHGFCEDGLVWSPLLPFLKKSRVIAIDLQGFGKSAPIARPSIEHYAQAVKAVLDAEKIGRCVLLGHSMGGYATLAFVDQFEGCVAGFGLVHSHPFADGAEKKAARDQGVSVLESGKKDSYLNLLFPALFTEKFQAENPKVLQLFFRRARRFPTPGIIGALEAMRDRPDRSAVLQNAKVPVFMFLGLQDSLLPPYAENTMLTMPSVADVHLIPDVAHTGMHECPEVLGKAISEFHTFVQKVEQ